MTEGGKLYCRSRFLTYHTEQEMVVYLPRSKQTVLLQGHMVCAAKAVEKLTDAMTFTPESLLNPEDGLLDGNLNVEQLAGALDSLRSIGMVMTR